MKITKILFLIILAVLILVYLFPRKEVPDVPVSEPDLSQNKTEFKYYNFKSEYNLIVKNCKNGILSVSVYVPQNIKNKQTVRKLEYSPEPKEITFEDGNKVAHFEIKNPKKATKIEIIGELGVNTYDYSYAVENGEKDNLSDIKRYTLPEPLIESDDESIIAKARELKGESDEETLRNIYYFVQQKMRYSAKNDTIGAKEMLKNQRGKCTDYSMLMIALCRANGIPARIVSGVIIEPDAQNHSWVEVWFDKYGWVLFEPTVISNKKYDFRKSPNEYMITGFNISSSVIVKLKVFSEDNRPRPDVLLALEEKTEFSETNQSVE